MIKLLLGDCLDKLKELPDKSVDCIIIDPPYNIGKSKEWDKWKTVNSYVEFMGKVFLQCQRVLKDNGSFYFFHNDFLQIVELQNFINKNTNFVFKQFIVWNKKFKGSSNEGFLQGYNEVNNLRNYQKMAEYILYYTFQDETGLTTVMLDTNNFSSLRKYFYDLLCYIGENNKGIAKKLGNMKAEHCFYVMPKKRIIEKIGQQSDHCFRYGSSQWDLPTKETYYELIRVFGIDKWVNFRPYYTITTNEGLRNEYERLRNEYERLRYTFNNQKTHHSVWNYDIAKKLGHITPKPLYLIENIIKYSSNENDLVLDCFMGSGTTGVACKSLGRNFIGIELDENYFKIASDRINKVGLLNNFF
jgi:site-specific DNA-methyltransferase (adenine-specific)